MVVEAVNFNDDGTHNTWRNTSWHSTLVERFTGVDVETLSYEFTATDPDTWEWPWTVVLPMHRTVLSSFGFPCHGGNRGVANILADDRRREAEAR